MSTETTQQDLNLVVTKDRMRDMPLETFYNVESSVKDMIDFVAHFLVGDDGEYLPKSAAVKQVITGRTLGDVEDIAERLRSSMEDSSVPKE